MSHDLCFMCDNEVDVKFSPCGHTAMCRECAQGAKRCPVCKVSHNCSLKQAPDTCTCTCMSTIGLESVEHQTGYHACTCSFKFPSRQLTFCYILLITTP